MHIFSLGNVKQGGEHNMLKLQQITAAYDEHIILHQLSFTFEKGKFYGILGPNGSGKSTLLKIMSGVLKCKEGTVCFNGVPIQQYSTKKLAQQMAVLTQFHHTAFSNTVEETVKVGRYPYQTGLFSSWSVQDEQAVQQALHQTGISKYAQEPMEYLSGGEQQRVFIAQALAQQAELLLLDEPTNHLDISYQKQTLDFLHQQVQDKGLTVVGIFHDINLASLYCDELLLLDAGEIIAAGEPHEVVQHQKIQQVYNATVSTYAHPLEAKPQITLLPSIEKKEIVVLKENMVNIEEEYIGFQSPIPLKTISSAVYNAGLGWYKTFINRTVASTYNVSLIEEEVEQFLKTKQYPFANSVVMLTAVPTSCGIVKTFEHDGVSIILVVTAGTKHAVDVSKAIERERNEQIGTINTFVLINGELAEEAFYQAMMTATEAKVKALMDQNIKDHLFHTAATGTGTDSLLIAATQLGEKHRYAGPLTKLGQLIGYGVYEATKEAIATYNNYVEKGHA